MHTKQLAQSLGHHMSLMNDSYFKLSAYLSNKLLSLIKLAYFMEHENGISVNLWTEKIEDTLDILISCTFNTKIKGLHK